MADLTPLPSTGGRRKRRSARDLNGERFRVFVVSTTGHPTKPGLTELTLAFRPWGEDVLTPDHLRGLVEALASDLDKMEDKPRRIEPHPELASLPHNDQVAQELNHWLRVEDGDEMRVARPFLWVANGQPTEVEHVPGDALAVAAELALKQTGNPGPLARWEARDCLGGLLSLDERLAFEVAGPIYLNLHPGDRG